MGKNAKLCLAGKLENYTWQKREWYKTPPPPTISVLWCLKHSRSYTTRISLRMKWLKRNSDRMTNEWKIWIFIPFAVEDSLEPRTSEHFSTRIQFLRGIPPNSLHIECVCVCSLKSHHQQSHQLLCFTKTFSSERARDRQRWTAAIPFNY